MCLGKKLINVDQFFVGLGKNTTIKKALLIFNETGIEAGLGKVIGEAIANNTGLIVLRLYLSNTKLNDADAEAIGKGIAANKTLQMTRIDLNKTAVT